MPEWRKDPVSERWVVIATERGKRPSDFRVQKYENRGGECALCERHEKDTPPEVLAYREEGTVRDTPGWWVRVIPNKFPAVKIEGGNGVRKYGIYEVMEGTGAHEVVVESPEHEKNFEDMSAYQVEEVIRAWRDRSRDLRRDCRFKYIQVFKNYGSVAGASLEHPHSQIIAVPMVPVRVWKEMEVLKNHAHSTGRCIICEMISQETFDRNRIISENANFVSVCPFASRFPFESWIMPKKHQYDFGQIEEDQVKDLAEIMGHTVKLTALTLCNAPYNMMIHTAPVNVETDGLIHYHWHIEIVPRLTTIAGYELSTGFSINPTPPEIAAKDLREFSTECGYGVYKESNQEVQRYV